MTSTVLAISAAYVVICVLLLTLGLSTLTFASGRTNDGSCEAVITMAVIPRRNRPTVPTNVSSSGALPSASTAASAPS